MIGEKVTGFCLDWDDDGLPEIAGCEARKVSTDGLLLITEEDGVGATYKHRVYRLFETFFLHEAPAMKALLTALEDTRRGHMQVMAEVEDRIEAARTVFEYERAKE